MDVYRRRAGRWLVVPVVAALAALGLVASPAQAQSSLRAAAADDYLVGTAVTPDWLNNSTYANIAATEFSSITAENHMKWDTLQPSEGNFNFGPANQIINFAQQNGQNVYGHTLVWHSQTPQWVQSQSGGQLQTTMQNHITTVMQELSAVSQWDVVNEAFEENGQRRQSFWQTGLGNGYIATAMQAARSADPSATLCLNDFNTHNDNAKSDAYFSLAQSFIQQGVPIDCMGFQTHLVLGEGLGTMQSNLQRFANLGLDVWVTELDIRITLPASTQQLQQQAQQFAQVYQICQDVGCEGLTVWGVHEEQSWVPDVFDGQGQALIWGNNFAVKPAYAAILDQLGGGGQQEEPPATPTGLSVTNTTATSVSLSWNASANATGYVVERAQGGGGFSTAGTPGTTSFTDNGLTPDTSYQYRVIATNSAGSSPPSGPVPATTDEQGTGGGDCEVSYSANNWGGSPGFTASVTVANTGSSAIDGWTVQWNYSAGQTIEAPGWNATVSQSGSSVTAVNAPWNGTIAPNGSTSFGFNGAATSVGNNPAPTSFSCTAG